MHLSKYGTLIWIFKKWDERAWTVLLWLRIRPGGGEIVNAVANVGNVLTSWAPCWLLRKDLLHGLS